MSTAMPSMSVGRWRPLGGLAVIGIEPIELQGAAPHEQPAQQHARGREQEQQPEDVGDEAGREQQHAAEDDQYAVDDLAVRTRPPPAPR